MVAIPAQTPQKRALADVALEQVADVVDGEREAARARGRVHLLDVELAVLADRPLRDDRALGGRIEQCRRVVDLGGGVCADGRERRRGVRAR